MALSIHIVDVFQYPESGYPLAGYVDSRVEELLTSLSLPVTCCIFDRILRFFIFTLMYIGSYFHFCTKDIFVTSRFESNVERNIRTNWIYIENGLTSILMILGIFLAICSLYSESVIASLYGIGGGLTAFVSLCVTFSNHFVISALNNRLSHSMHIFIACSWISLTAFISLTFSDGIWLVYYHKQSIITKLPLISLFLLHLVTCLTFFSILSAYGKQLTVLAMLFIKRVDKSVVKRFRHNIRKVPSFDGSSNTSAINVSISSNKSSYQSLLDLEGIITDIHTHTRPFAQDNDDDEDNEEMMEPQRTDTPQPTATTTSTVVYKTADCVHILVQIFFEVCIWVSIYFAFKQKEYDGLSIINI